MKEPYIDTKEAAKFLALSVRTLRAYISASKAGGRKFPYYQDFPPNGAYYFKVSELELWRFDSKRF